MSTPQGKFRYLTAGEVGLMRMIFADSICYTRVKVYNGKWKVLLGMQRDDTVMTPNGNIYYPYDLFREDFSGGGPDNVNLQVFIHEMVHVWQYQHGYPVKWHGILSFDKSRYRYELGADKRLSDYNMEAQANLLADYLWLQRYGDYGAGRLFEERYRGGSANELLPLYRRVIADFILNPHDESNLPGNGKYHQENRSKRSFKGGCPQ